MYEMKEQRHKAAQRQPADDRAFDGASVKNRRHVSGRRLERVHSRIGRAVGAAVAAHVPADQPVAAGKRRDLRVPHTCGCAKPVRQQHRGAGAVVFIVETDAVTFDGGHGTGRSSNPSR